MSYRKRYKWRSKSKKKNMLFLQLSYFVSKNNKGEHTHANLCRSHTQSKRNSSFQLQKFLLLSFPGSNLKKKGLQLSLLLVAWSGYFFTPVLFIIIVCTLFAFPYLFSFFFFRCTLKVNQKKTNTIITKPLQQDTVQNSTWMLEQIIFKENNKNKTTTMIRMIMIRDRISLLQYHYLLYCRHSYRSSRRFSKLNCK